MMAFEAGIFVNNSFLRPIFWKEIRIFAPLWRQPRYNCSTSTRTACPQCRARPSSACAPRTSARRRDTSTPWACTRGAWARRSRRWTHWRPRTNPPLRGAGAAGGRTGAAARHPPGALHRRVASLSPPPQAPGAVGGARIPGQTPAGCRTAAPRPLPLLWRTLSGRCTAHHAYRPYVSGDGRKHRAHRRPVPTRLRPAWLPRAKPAANPCGECGKVLLFRQGNSIFDFADKPWLSGRFSVYLHLNYSAMLFQEKLKNYGNYTNCCSKR